MWSGVRGALARCAVVGARWLGTALLALAGAAAPVSGEALPIEARVIEDGFSTFAAVLQAASASALPRSMREDREHMGGIFEANASGAFLYSVAVGRAGRDELTIRLRSPAGYRLIAIWHTHGAAGFARGFFSERDTGLANSLGVPIYLALPGGSLRVYRPGDPTLSAAQAHRLRLARRGGISAGSRADVTQHRAERAIALRESGAPGDAPAS